MSIWFIARGAGLSAMVLLTASTCLGALSSGRGTIGTRVVGQYVHRVVASLGLAVLALHIWAILTDSYAHVGWVGALVPFTSGYEPNRVAIGSLAVYSVVVAALVGATRRGFANSRHGAAVWRYLHGVAYLACGLSILHGFTTGTDSSVGWVRVLYVLCLVALGSTLAVRLARPHRPDLVRHAEPARELVASR
jgi:predicted ferric reductase